MRMLWLSLKRDEGHSLLDRVTWHKNNEKGWYSYNSTTQKFYLSLACIRFITSIIYRGNCNLSWYPRVV